MEQQFIERLDLFDQTVIKLFYMAITTVITIHIEGLKIFIVSYKFENLQ